MGKGWYNPRQPKLGNRHVSNNSAGGTVDIEFCPNGPEVRGARAKSRPSRGGERSNSCRCTCPRAASRPRVNGAARTGPLL